MVEIIAEIPAKPFITLTKSEPKRITLQLTNVSAFGTRYLVFFKRLFTQQAAAEDTDVLTITGNISDAENVVVVLSDLEENSTYTVSASICRPENICSENSSEINLPTQEAGKNKKIF